MNTPGPNAYRKLSPQQRADIAVTVGGLSGTAVIPFAVVAGCSNFSVALGHTAAVATLGGAVAPFVFSLAVAAGVGMAVNHGLKQRDRRRLNPQPKC